MNEINKYGFLRLKQIIGTRDEPGMIPVSRATLYQMMSDGKFPRPVNLGPRAVAWRKNDVLKWLESWNEDELTKPTKPKKPYFCVIMNSNKNGKTCPFCGSKKLFLEFTPPLFSVRCDECLAESGLRKSEEEAIDAWNMRQIGV